MPPVCSKSGRVQPLFLCTRLTRLGPLFVRWYSPRLPRTCDPRGVAPCSRARLHGFQGPAQPIAPRTVYHGRVMSTLAHRAARRPFECIVIALLLSVFASAQAPHPSNAQLADPQLNAKVEALLTKLTLE